MSHDWLDTPPAADPEVYGQRLSSRERSILQRDLQSLADSLGLTCQVIRRPDPYIRGTLREDYIATAVLVARARVVRIAQAWGVPVSPLPASTEGGDDAPE